MTLGAVSAGDPWHLEEDARASILWDIAKSEEWVEALTEAEEVEAIYIVTKQKAAFKELADVIKEALPPLTREREVMRPIADGFEENLAYYELGFLDPGEVARGHQFAAILPLLWMLTGSRGECPKPGRIDRWLIAANCGFAVLHKEALFEDFRTELTRVDSIDHVFLVTDSEEAFKEMRSGLGKGTQATMLYSSYLRNFGINTGAAQ